MNRKTLLPATLAIVMTVALPVQVRSTPSVSGEADPNAANRQREILQEQQKLEDKRRSDEQQRAQIDKFLAVVKPRKWHYLDFDQVVIHGKAPMSPQVLALIAQSYYAADIAYYLGKHPDQALIISRMPAANASQAVKTIESTLIARGA